ncbi:cyclase family protein [Humisphaera borealis]|uniref:Cyclase family protein n=1 Tax=Humisphaera borealis TaxID=2807512 RepID=A0A7M2WV95_9BACT|nr:cyclase family protein [Humisphaera borealis]QOV89477.1 cyclase family protein [Humisphaera borealis]
MRSISLTLAMLMVLAGCATGGKAGGTNHGSGGDPSPRPVAIDPAKVIDLSYAFGDQTIYWPTAEPFKLRRVAYGRTPGGYFYAANNISMAEHGGTHMDAPIHFAEGKRTSGELPLSNCIGPAAVIDVRAADADYLLTVDDPLGWERAHGRLPRGAIVIMHSGWGERWSDKKRYLGTDVPLDVAWDRRALAGMSKSRAGARRSRGANHDWLIERSSHTSTLLRVLRAFVPFVVKPDFQKAAGEKRFATFRLLLNIYRTISRASAGVLAALSAAGQASPWTGLRARHWRV